MKLLLKIALVIIASYGTLPMILQGMNVKQAKTQSKTKTNMIHDQFKKDFEQQQTTSEMDRYTAQKRSTAKRSLAGLALIASGLVYCHFKRPDFFSFNKLGFYGLAGGGGLLAIGFISSIDSLFYKYPHGGIMQTYNYFFRKSNER